MFQIELKTKTGDQLVTHAYLESLIDTPKLVIWHGRYFIHVEGLVYWEVWCVPAKDPPKVQKIED